MNLLDDVRSAWGWTGIKPVELIDENDFGNLILKDVHARDQEFLADWHMGALVGQAFQ